MSKQKSTNTLTWHLRRMEAVCLVVSLIFLILTIWWSGYRLQSGLTGVLFFLIGVFLGGCAAQANKIERRLDGSQEEKS